jgi:hypothetical protein
MNAAKLERLRTFAFEICVTLLPEGTKTRREGGATRFLGQGGLLVFDDGSWFRHSTREGRIGADAALRLIQALGNMAQADAEIWAAAWLQSHPGVGSCTDAVDEAATAPASAIDAEDLLNRVEDPHGTVVETYLRSRRIEPPFPDCIKIFRNARVGEDALAAILTARGRIVGIELTYIATGQKSTVAPQRRTFKREALPDAIFDIPSPGDSTEIVIAEGVPDMGTVYRWGKCRCRIIGLPGIGTLRHLRFPKGTKITVVAQGDAPNSPAAKDLQAGLDKLILDGCDTHVTPIPPLGEDANSILQGHGVEAVQLLLDNAAPAKLSLDGEIEKLARLDDLAYAQIRKAEAKRLGITQVGILDKERQKHRAAHAAAPPGSDWDDISADPVAHEEVDLADTLDRIVKELSRYIVASKTALDTIVLWCAHTHLVYHKFIKLTVSPRLGVQAADYGSGKTVALECVACLVPNAVTASNITASSLFRSIALEHPTFILDEVHLLLHSRRDPELLQIMNASHRRKSAKIRTSEPLPNGGWQPVEYDVWCTMALASVGELPRDQQERCVIVNLSKALSADVPEHLEDGTSSELELLCTMLVVWAAGLEELPRPELPDELQRQHGRVGDNWRSLLAIAELAGRHWPQLALDAALAAVTGEKKLSLIQRLLISIRKAFSTFNPPKPGDSIETGELLRRLINDPDEEWNHANNGRAVTAYWLRDNLRGLLDPPGSLEWQVSEEDSRRHTRGYRRFQFTKAWRVHLAGVEEKPEQDFSFSSPEETSGTSRTSGEPIDNIEQFETASGTAPGTSGTDGTKTEPVPDIPDAVPDAKANTSTISNISPDAPDVPDPQRGTGKNIILNGPLPNGDDRTGKRRYRRRGDLARDIREFAATHQNLTPEKIAKRFGVSRSRVERILGPAT